MSKNTIDFEHTLTEELYFPPELVSANVVDFFKTCTAMCYLYAKKNHDYGNSFTKDIDEIGDAYGIGRLYDKMNRLITLIKVKPQVKDESVLDTIQDLACYSVMLHNYYTNKEK